MLLDNFLSVGKSHQICEDYTIIGDSPAPYMIVSDGCSSSKNTDVGARLLSYSAAKQFKKAYSLLETDPRSISILGKTAIFLANDQADALALNNSCLDCTLLFLYATQRMVYVNVWGDGYVIVKTKAGNVIIQEITYSENAPFYLNYILDDRKIEWENKFANNPRIVTEYYSDNDSNQYSTFMTTPVETRLEIDTLDCMMIASDGLGSFIKQETGEKIPIREIVDQILDIKVRNGEYLKRRMRKMLEKNAANGIYNYDDISISSIIF